MQSLQVRESRRSLNLCLRLVGQSVGYVVCATRMPRFVGAFANATTWVIIKCKYSSHSFHLTPDHLVRIYIPATTVSQPASTTVTLTTSNTMPRKHKNAAEHEAAVAAITAHFSDTYISGNGRLAAYQQLCRDLDVDVGASIIQCKRVGFCNEYRGIDQRADHPTTTEHQRRPRQHPRFRPRAAARRRYQLLQVPELQCSAQGYHGQPRQEIPAKESKI